MGLLFVLLQTTGSWRWSASPCCRSCWFPRRAWDGASAAPRRRAQDNAAELNQILQETLSGHQVVKAFGDRRVRIEPLPRAPPRSLRKSNLRYVLQQAMASPLIELFGALTIVGLLTYARTQIKAGPDDRRAISPASSIALLMLYEPVKRLTGIHNIFEQAIGRVAESLRVPGPQPRRSRTSPARRGSSASTNASSSTTSASAIPARRTDSCCDRSTWR